MENKVSRFTLTTIYSRQRFKYGWCKTDKRLTLWIRELTVLQNHTFDWHEELDRVGTKLFYLKNLIKPQRKCGKAIGRKFGQNDSTFHRLSSPTSFLAQKKTYIRVFERRYAKNNDESTFFEN